MMPAMDWLLPVVAAPFVGSFLGVVVTRFPGFRGMAWGRSRCPSCGHALGAADLVPILSWAARRGRCAHCAAAIGAIHPLVEVAALAIALWTATAMPDPLLWASCALGWTLLALALIDLRCFVLPDAMTLPLLGAGLVVGYLLDPSRALDHAAGAAAGFLAFAAVAAAYRRLRGRDGLGLGDAKLLAAAGAWLTWTGLPSVVLIAAASALAAALFGRAFDGRPLSLARRVPFGPYLALGLWLVWLYGPLEFRFE